MKTRKRFTLLIVLTLLAMACQCPLPSIFTRPSAHEPLPPQVIQVIPERGEEQRLDAPLQLTFDQAMDAASVEAAFSIEPEVEGDFEWATPRVLRFTPREGFRRGVRYTLVIDDEAASAAGVKMRNAFQYRFTTVGFLEVTSVQPAPDATEIAADAVVTVVFNRPVVSLTAIESQDDLPQPLAFTPEVDGTGKWLNTSIYTFTPAEGFAPATAYEARIAAGLADTTGGLLAEDFVWRFTTVMPAVVATHPAHNALYVSPEPTIYVAFNQPVDHASAEAAFEMRNAATGERVTGSFAWYDQGLVPPEGEAYQPYQWSWSEGAGPTRVGAETMAFTPAEPLALNQRYEARVAAGVEAAGGQAATADEYVWRFTTIAPPRITSTDPADGARGITPGDGLLVHFASPMDPASFAGNLSISPPVTSTEVYTYWWNNDTSLSISFYSEPNTDYQVTISGRVQGRYGHTLGQDAVIRWRTRALDPIVYLQSPGNIATHSAYTATWAYVAVRNVSQVHFALYRMPLADFLSAQRDWWEYWQNYHGVPDNLVRTWTIETAPPLNQRRLYGAPLSESADGLLAPGVYYLEVWADDGDIYPQVEGNAHAGRSKQILVVSRYNLTFKRSSTEALVWATDTRSGEAVPDLPVAIVNDQGRVIVSGITDSDGVFAAEIGDGISRWDTLLAFSGNRRNPDEEWAVVSSGWDSGITTWEFGLPTTYYEEPYAAYLFTDRPIYRPGQTVYFKGVLRRDDDARYSLPAANRRVRVLITDPNGVEVFDDTLPLSDLGTLDGSFELDEEAALGVYFINVSQMGQYLAYADFRVAEYRKPEFEVTVETDRAEYVHGDRIAVTAQATYFFGGPVANAAVRYAVLSADHYFDYQGPGWWSFADWSYDMWGYEPSYGAYGELIADGEGVTDAEGRFTFTLEADIADQLLSQRYTLEVTVTDVNNQQVSNRTEAIVHKGLYYIGLQPAEYVGRAGDESRVNIITVDWESEPSPGRELTVVFAHRNWYSVQRQAEDGYYYWESVVEDTPVYTTTVTTDRNGAASVGFTPEEGGTYRVAAIGRDERGNEIRSAAYLWVSGAGYIAWQQDNNDRIELVADKREYQVGDTASILIPHPYQGPVQALVTVERGHIYDYWVQTLETNSEVIEIPITEDMIPNVFISVVIVRGMEGGGLPGFKVGYVELPIQTTEKELTITMTPDRPPDQHYQPGDTVTYAIQVADSAGHPVEAELTLALVDKAVLTLAERRGPDIVGYFWRERGLNVGTAVGLTLSGDRIREEAAEEVKGMGGGGGGEEFGPARSRFPDLAYWNAALRTDANGRASVSVELPDNLTTWRMSAWGVTAETLVGQAEVDIVSAKDLMVQPSAPRFFIVGDEAVLAAVVHNRTARALEVEVVFEAQGLQIGAPASQRVRIPVNDRVRVTWPVTVENDVEEVALRFGARAAGLTDAVAITLPVYRNSTPEVVATAGYLDEDGQMVEAVALPPSFDPTQGELTVEVAPSLAAGMIGGLDYLEHYPYECTEQTVSRFLPNVVTYRAFTELGIEPGARFAPLPDLVNQGLQRLYSQQRYDGGWGWWSEDESRPYLTAYVLLGMIEAKRAGFAVDESVMARAVDYLQDALAPSRDVRENWRANQQAFILYVLAEAGEGDRGRTVALFGQRETLDAFGEAYLAMALALLNPDDARVDTLLSDIASAAIVSAVGAHWEEAQPDYYAMNTDTRSTAIILAALARLDPENALAPGAARWLMAARKEGYWETTQETAWSLIALTDWMVATGELEGAYDWRVVVNDALLGEGSVTPETVDQTTELQIEIARLLADEANRVVIERWAPEGQEEGSGRLYYGLYLRYYKPAEEIPALSRGVIVSRQYTLASCDPEEEACPAVRAARVGDVLRVKLTIIAPHDLHYVVVEDPFPAGAEGIDQSLRTTSVVAERPELVRTDRYDPWWGYGWWWFSHTELRDEKAVLFATYLPAGTYEYTYLIRAGFAGEYRALPTTAYEMYFPEVFGRSDGVVFTITE